MQWWQHTDTLLQYHTCEGCLSPGSVSHFPFLLSPARSAAVRPRVGIRGRVRGRCQKGPESSSSGQAARHRIAGGLWMCHSRQTGHVPVAVLRFYGWKKGFSDTPCCLETGVRFLCVRFLAAGIAISPLVAAPGCGSTS